jgi:acyl-CoA thioesterase-2
MSALAKLLRRLDLPRVNDWEFAGGAGIGGATEAQRLFGGLVLAQAAVAAARTVDGTQMHMHSMHALFLRPGQAKTPIRFVVSPIKQGRNYHARLVTALQPDRDGEQTVFQMQASFGRFDTVADPAHRAEHQDAMRAVPPPAQAKNRDLLRGRDPAAMPIEVRMIDALDEDRPAPPTTAIWIRANGELPDDPVLRLATLVYATDRAFLGTAWRPHAGKGRLAGASLDHSLWFHERITFDDWLLFEMHSPAARFERGLVFGGLYTADGRRVASASQEGSLAFQPNAQPVTRA